MTEAEEVTQLMQSAVDGQRSAEQVAELLDLPLPLIERGLGRRIGQRLGLPANPPDDFWDYASRMLYRCMGKNWQDCAVRA